MRHEYSFNQLNLSAFAARLAKVQKHLSKWAKRENISCYRLYQKDLNDFPVIVDWYDGDIVTWLFERKKDESDEQKQNFIADVVESICTGLGVTKHHVYVKHRFKLKGLQTQYEKIAELGKAKTVNENGLLFEVNLTDYLDTGLFLDHRNTRSWVRELSHNKKVLNLFAYTGSFTCYAISGGATTVTTVDLNPNYIAWAKRNVMVNKFSLDPHLFIVEDCRSYLKKTQEKFDLIICDPPTFSNSKRTSEGVWVVDEDYAEMIQLCVSKLTNGGKLIFSTNSKSFKFDISQFSYRVVAHEVTHKFVPMDFRHRQIHRSWEVTCLTS